MRTTNGVESPFAAVRLRAGAAKPSKKVENANAGVWKTVLVAAPRFRRLDAPECLPEVAEGVAHMVVYIMESERSGATRRPPPHLLSLIPRQRGN